MFLILCACALVYMFIPDQANIYIYIYVCVHVLLQVLNAHYLLVSRFTSVHFNMNCMNVHVLNIL